jgi:hypothetical protein
MTPAAHNLTIYRDRDFSQVFILKDGDGVVINLAQYTVKAQMRPAKDSAELILEFTVAVVTAEGKITLSLTDVQTLALDEDKVRWDLAITDPAGLRQNYVEGSVTIKGTVTRAA